MDVLALLTTMGILVVMVIGTIAVLISRGHRDASAPGAPANEALLGADLEDLDELFSAVDAEGMRARRGLVTARLEHLRSHRVPLRQLHGSPVPTVARLGFADGSVLLARSIKPGDLVDAARLQQHGGLVVTEFGAHDQGVAVVLTATTGDGRCELIVLGLDQPD